MTSPTPNVNNFDLNDGILDELEASLSAERLGTYLTATGGDRAGAVKLYTWNTAVSAAFYGPLQALEVALRNAMNRELASVYGQEWYDNRKAGLDGGCLARVEQTKQALRKDKYPDDAPHVIASLSFGLWVSLLGAGGFINRKTKTKANYEMTLWRPALRRAFPHAANISRKDVHAPLNFLRTFRNRIAHHEPIFARHLEKDYENILEVAAWIAQHKRAWIEAHSRVPDILATPRNAENLKF
ncbi:MAG: Abi family protein [Pseudomonadota bacterium]